MPAPDKGDTERRMIGAASSSSSSAAAAAASSSAAAAAAANGDGEEAEGPKVDETQLERMYRLNEAASKALPEFQGPVAGLRGLELWPYQRQALAWMLRREEGVEEEEAVEDEAVEAEQGGDGEGGGGPSRAGKRRRSAAEGKPLGVHLDMGLQQEADEDVVEIVGGGGGSSSASRVTGGRGSRTQVELHQGLVQVAPATAKRLAHVRSFHPLWDRHFLALPLECGYAEESGKVEEKGLGFPLPFYSNPYSKRLSLPVPPPPRPCRGGMLCDDMGMGKTIMVLALILESKARALRQSASASASASAGTAAAASASESGKRPRGRPPKVKDSGDAKGAAHGPTLVVVPLSVLSQWHREIQAFSAPRALAVSVYYGPDRPSDPHFLRSQDVVISTYGTLQSDYAGGSGGAARVDADGMISGAKSGLYSVRWGRVVLDEAHNIKVIVDRLLGRRGAWMMDRCM